MEKLKRFLQRLGHVQAQILLTLLFVLCVIPYAWLLRVFGRTRLPGGEWRDVEERQPDLKALRRMF